MNDSRTENIDVLWNITEDFSITEAAALVAGYDPLVVEFSKNDTNFCLEFSKYFIAFKAIVHAITNNRLQACIRYSSREYGYADARNDVEYAEIEGCYQPGRSAQEDEVLSEDHSCFYKPFPDWTLSTVNRDDLIEWLKGRGVKTGFFFPTATDAPDYLDPNKSRYAPRLAAAVKAWQAMEDENLRRRKSAKAAMEQWIESNYRALGLIHKRDSEKHGYKAGDMNKTAVQEAAKIANWEDDGGAPKTPGK